MIDVTVSPLQAVASQLAAGKFEIAERQLAQMILDHIGRPGGPSLFRIFQLNTDDSVTEKFDDFKDAVTAFNDPLLTASFQTIVGPSATDEMTSVQSENYEHAYINMVDGHERKVSRKMLFQQPSDNLLWVNMNIPISTCNYRCSYCYLDHEVKPSVENIANLGEIIAQLGRIPRPIAVTLTTWGEILAMPTIFPYFAQLAALPNFVYAEIWTNLSRDLTGITKYIPVEKLAVLTSYHPSEFKNYEEQHQKYLERVEYLRDNAYDVTVNFVVSSAEMPYFPRMKADLRRLGVYFTVNPLVGLKNGDGKLYPDAFSKPDVRKITKWYGNDVAAAFHLGAKAKIRCTAGRDLIDIKPDGSVDRCEHFTKHPAEPSYGNILAKTGPTIDLTSRYCPIGGCGCKSTVGYSDPVVAEYKRAGTQHHFIRREPGEIGTHSFDPVKRESIVPTIPLVAPTRQPEPVAAHETAQDEAENRVPAGVAG